MATTFMSQEGYIGIAPQTASGTYRTPTKYLYVQSFEGTTDEDFLIKDPEIGAGSDVLDNQVYRGPVKYSLSGEFAARPEALPLLFAGLLGAVTSSSIGGTPTAYGHTISPVDTEKPLSIEHAVGSATESWDVIGYTDAFVNTLGIEGNAGEFVTGTVEMLAITQTAGKTRQTPTFETSPILTYAGGSVLLEGNAIPVRSVSLEINRNLIDDDFRVGSRSLETVQGRRRELSATLEIVPTNTDLFRKAGFGGVGSTTAPTGAAVYTGSLFLRFESKGTNIGTGASAFPYQMDVTIDKAAFRAMPIPTSGDDQFVQTLELLPVKSTTDIIKIIFRNTTVNYT